MEESETKEICKGCKKEFPENVLLRHVGQAKKCKAVYGHEYEALKQEKSLAKKAR